MIEAPAISIDDAARALGRARQNYEDRDTDDNYRRMLEAQITFLTAEVRAAKREAVRHRSKALAAARALDKANRLLASAVPRRRAGPKARQGSMEIPGLFEGME